MTEHKCEAHVADWTGFNFHVCGKPAKYVNTEIWMGQKRVEYLCGTHSRTVRKFFPEQVMTVEEYEKCQPN